MNEEFAFNSILVGYVQCRKRKDYKKKKAVRAIDQKSFDSGRSNAGIQIVITSSSVFIWFCKTVRQGQRDKLLLSFYFDPVHTRIQHSFINQEQKAETRTDYTQSQLFWMHISLLNAPIPHYTELIFDTQVSLAPTHVSPLVDPSYF